MKHIKVKVQTGSRREYVSESKRDILHIEVKEKPERNEANNRVRAIVAEHFSIPVRLVKIVSGHKRPNKVIAIMS